MGGGSTGQTSSTRATKPILVKVYDEYFNAVYKVCEISETDSQVQRWQQQISAMPDLSHVIVHPSSARLYWFVVLPEEVEDCTKKNHWNAAQSVTELGKSNNSPANACCRTFRSGVHICSCYKEDTQAVLVEVRSYIAIQDVVNRSN